MAAESDLIFCGGNCHGIVDGPNSTASKAFGAAKPFEVYIQPKTGHGMNIHHNATGMYSVVQNFLKTHSL
jgi:hypothetical protein